MRASWSLALVALVTAFVVRGAAVGAQSAPTGDPRLEPEEIEMFALINAYRGEHGLGPLVPSALLDRVAHEHSVDMATRGYFEHDSPEGRSPFDRMRAGGYPGGSMGENLAAGNADAASTLVQWRHSPPHDAALLEGDYHAAGLGRVCVPGSEYECYWTLDLGDVVDPSAFALPAVPAATASAPAAPAAQPAPSARPGPSAGVTAQPRVARGAAAGRHRASRGAHAVRRPPPAHGRPARGRVIVVDVPVDDD